MDKTMIQLGKTQDLIIIKTTEFGVYLSERLDKDTPDRVLLPKNQVPKNARIGDFITYSSIRILKIV